ncbi:hypothetical protein HanIR_Chr15g0767291 [Helianthus annuus]|nr:hypothetical protein HanIR_Chr15g0767291 [Helianthus annuus]
MNYDYYSIGFKLRCMFLGLDRSRVHKHPCIPSSCCFCCVLFVATMISMFSFEMECFLLKN